MRVIGIIAEYNPFHKGHEYLIRQARKAVADPRAVVMSVMSGPFTQRGLPAVAPKHIRAKQALKCGCDVVIELPFEWACAPASEFAYGAVRTLMLTGVVTDIAFGIDGGTPEMIEYLSYPSLYESDAYKSALKDALASGMNFPAASAKAVISSASCPFDPEQLSECLRSPNCILAVEYLKAMKELGAGFKVHMIRRIGQGYSDSDYSSEEILSASAIRNCLRDSGGSVSTIADAVCGKLPDASVAVLLGALSQKKFTLTDLDKYAVRAVTTPVSDPDAVRFCGDGLGGYIANVLSDLRSDDMTFDKLSSKLATKHFTMPRIYRALTMMMLGIQADQTDKEPSYVRVLGFNHNGKYCLKIIGKCCRVPVIHNQSDLLEHPELAKSMSISCRAEDLSGSFMGIAPASAWNEPPVITK